MVTPAELTQIGKAAHPSRIPTDSRELGLLRDYLLATNEKQGAGIARRSSAWLLLDLLRLGISADNEPGIRQAFYNRKRPNGSPYAGSGLTIDRWRAFQANELCHISFEALLNGLLAQLREYPHGLEPDFLIKKLLEPLLATLGTEGRTWSDWAIEIGSSFSGSEEILAEKILLALGDVDLSSSQASLSSALQLVATLWLRWNGEDASVRHTIERYAGKGGRSLLDVLRTLNEQATNSVEQAIRSAIRGHLIADHLKIAGRKLAASGTFTYHFTLSDGVMADGRLAEYAYTNPRLQNLIRFLRDAHLYDGTAVTPAGTRFLNEGQPL